MRILSFFILIVISNQLFAQNTIEDARRQNIGSTVTVSGIVINDDELGLIRYIQDATAGIAVYDDKLSTTQKGDSITLSGTLDDYNNLLEIKDVSTYTKHSSGHILPGPKILSIVQIGESYEGQLVRINSIEFSNAGGTFSGNTNYTFSDGSTTGELRISSSSSIVGQPIPSGKFSLIAICSQYSFENNDTRNGYQLLPRDMNDFISSNSVNFTSSINAVDISKNSITLGWSTDAGAFPFVRYGNENTSAALSNYKSGDSTTSEDENVHVAEITGLQASEIIYAQAFMVLESDTVYSNINAYVTESNSSGRINVYFNTNVDNTLATETDAMDIGNFMEDTLAAYINQAEESIDLCIYNFDNNTVSTALNAAFDRGVSVRVITCGSTSHYSINDLNSGISVLERPETSTGGIMHNKFAIFDGNSNDANKAWIWSGSTNLTQTQLFSDANNMIFIQDQSLAKTYEIEFEEMWGSTDNQANSGNAKFGAAKTNNTPHDLMIRGYRVECYFSPSDNTNQKLIDAISTADFTLDVQTMIITRSDLADAIMAAQDRGTEVNVITDDERDNTENVNTILGGLPSGKYIFDDKASATLHHKMAIIDAKETSSDPQVITGSHNWSNSANDRNDENTLIIHNADITNQYYQQFAYRFEQNGGKLVLAASEIEIENLKIYPNPTENRIYISSKELIKTIALYSIQGTLIQQISPEFGEKNVLDLTSQKSGIYILKVEDSNNRANTYKIVKK
ncbi:phospholipase D-like domain-containing protein [uncultured Draconibacterium sp.]|uniref:phospholipase D-like domain-containing protein n=1 Tax=uncultured Draconibacterium sp. TaxID=1573823 RepID=UPI00321694AF